MVLIADSGGTKTEWVVLDGMQKLLSLSTAGLNPNFNSENEISNVIQHLYFSLPEAIKLDSIFFYGAGCGSSENAHRVASIISKIFGESVHVEIFTDLLGVARAVSPSQESVACILGTGSNACVTNGKTIVHPIPSWGYLFGDFGSGCDIGKRTLQHYFENSLTEKLQKSFRDWLSLSDTEILNQLYRQPRPNKFLAHITQFHSEFIGDEFLFSIRESSFRDFFIRQLHQLPKAADYPLHFFGSVAWFFQKDIKMVGDTLGYEIYSLNKSPMDGLLNFHRNNL